jgi:hypothetical protein
MATPLRSGARLVWPGRQPASSVNPALTCTSLRGQLHVARRRRIVPEIGTAGAVARVGPTTPKQFSAKHQTCANLAAQVPPNSTLEMGVAEMGAAIRSPVVGGSPRGTEDGWTAHLHPGAVVAPIQWLLTMAWPVFDLGSFCTPVIIDS